MFLNLRTDTHTNPLPLLGSLLCLWLIGFLVAAGLSPLPGHCPMCFGWWSQDMEHDHGSRMSEAEAAVRRLQIECEHQLEIERDRCGAAEYTLHSMRSGVKIWCDLVCTRCRSGSARRAGMVLSIAGCVAGAGSLQG